MKKQSPKPQLHQSHLQMLYRCGEKFRRVVLDGEHEPATTPLVVGTSTHISVARNLEHKIERGHLLTKDAVQDFTRDDFIHTWNESQIVLSDEERFAGLQKTRDELQDVTIQLVTEHHYELAPKIQPKKVERKWVLKTTDDYDYDLAGMIDVDEEKMVIPRGQSEPIKLTGIRDTKTRKQNLGAKEVETSEQYTMYAMAKFIIDGVMPDYVAQDNLVKPTKTRDAYATSYTARRTTDDFDVLYRRIKQADRIVKAGAFTPANPSDWWCSKEFCGFAANGTCPFFNSKSRNPIKPEVEKDERRESESTIESLKSTLSKENE